MGAELPECGLDGDGKAEPFEGGPNLLFGVDAQNLPFGIDQGAAAVAGIDLSIGLDEIAFKARKYTRCHSFAGFPMAYTGSPWAN